MPDTIERTTAVSHSPAGMPQIVVKLRDDFPIEYADAAERQLKGEDARHWDAFSAALASLNLGRPSLDRLFPAQSPEAISALVARAAERDPTYQPPNFLRFFIVRFPEARLEKPLDPKAFEEALKFIEPREWTAVEHAYVRAVHASALCFTPADTVSSLATTQKHLAAPPAPAAAGVEFGINADGAWNLSGCGGGIRALVLESAYENNAAFPAGATAVREAVAAAAGMVPSQQQKNHGTNSIGLIVAQNAVAGQYVGVAPNAQILVASTMQTTPDDVEGVLLTSLNLAAPDTLLPGDVVLIEKEILVWDATLSQYVTLPVEGSHPPGPTAVYQLIRLATALGIVVVEPAGNGARNIDGYLAPGSVMGTYLDSGAIMVGASVAASTVLNLKNIFARIGTSNFGARLNCFARGIDVKTTEGLSGVNDHFDGTSAASAIIAGAAVAVQSAALATLGHTLSPQQLRKVLSDSATGTACDAAAPIGVMPNLGSVIGTLTTLPDPYLRDFVGDAGDPHAGAISASPDIILRNAISATPDIDFGAATEADANLGEAALAGQDNFIYVRLKNRGGAQATNVTVDVYWSAPATLLSASTWLNQKVGTATISPLQAGNLLTVISTPITWSAAAIPAPGHYCFVAIVGSTEDPAPNPQDFLDWDNYRAFIRNNNNVTWRNFNVASPAMPSMHKAFLFAGAPDRAEDFDLELFPQLPPGARLILDAPDDYEPLRKHANMHVTDKGRIGIALDIGDGRRRIRLPNLPAPKGGAIRLGLDLILPKEFWHREHRVAVRQLWRGEEVGRITFRYTLEAPGRLGGKDPQPGAVDPRQPQPADCVPCRLLRSLFCKLFNCKP